MELRKKLCNKCKQQKTEFHKDSYKKDGFCTICADCKRQHTKVWTAENLEKSREKALKWYHDNKTSEELKIKRANCSKTWLKNNPDKNCAKQARRHARKLSATPPWLTSEQNAHMNRTYKLCNIISEATGEKYHVDHIVPLQGKNVCGLHVPWNLRVIPAKLNLEKSNKYDQLSPQYPD
jgi:hypothetical protein